MFFSVTELAVHKIRFDTTYQPGEVELLDSSLRQPEPFTVRGTAELWSDIREIRVHGHLAGRVQCDCDLCLEVVDLALDGDFDLRYRPVEMVTGGEASVPEDETEVGFYRGGGLDLADVIREQVLLWLPMRRLCRPDCQGMCPVCGANRNREACACRRPGMDSRWDALRELKR